MDGEKYKEMGWRKPVSWQSISGYDAKFAMATCTSASAVIIQHKYLQYGPKYGYFKKKTVPHNKSRNEIKGFYGSG